MQSPCPRCRHRRSTLVYLVAKVSDGGGVGLPRGRGSEEVCVSSLPPRRGPGRTGVTQGTPSKANSQRWFQLAAACVRTVRTASGSMATSGLLQDYYRFIALDATDRAEYIKARKNQKFVLGGAALTKRPGLIQVVDLEREREREREKTTKAIEKHASFFVFVPHKRDPCTRPMRALSRHDGHQALALVSPPRKRTLTW